MLMRCPGMVVSIGPQHKTRNDILPLMGIPKMVPLILGNPLVGMCRDVACGVRISGRVLGG